MAGRSNTASTACTRWPDRHQPRQRSRSTATSLGLKFIARFDPPGLAFFSLGGGTRLMLSATRFGGTLYFLVDGREGRLRRLPEARRQFLQPPAMVHRDEAGQFGKKGNEEWMAFFKDPGGNMLALVEKR